MPRTAAPSLIRTPPSPGALWFSDSGLSVDATRIAPRPGLARSLGDPDRLSLRLAIAFRRRLSPHLVRHVVEAAALSLRGDHVLANLRLVFADLARVPAPADLDACLGLAETLIEAGMTPAELLDALEADDEGLKKYDSNQPRVPSGSPDGGRWTNGGTEAAPSIGVTAAAVAAAPEAAETGALLVTGLGAGTLAALSGLAATVGFGAVFGTLFVPSSNSVSSTGSLPGDPNTTYDYNHDEGLLRLRDAAGNVLAAGHKNASGVFVDAETGVPFARELDGALMFGAAAVAAVRQEEDEQSGVVPRVTAERPNENDPRLCPEPGPDQPSGRPSDKAIAYQEQISAMVNPQRPLEYGLAIGLLDPSTLKVVHFDECDERSGTMIEAKGPTYARLLSFPAGQESVERDFLKQARRQVAAAGARDIVWYFAEQGAATFAAELFSKTSGLETSRSEL